jgi:hypothetical protein
MEPFCKKLNLLMLVLFACILGNYPDLQTLQIYNSSNLNKTYFNFRTRKVGAGI